MFVVLVSVTEQQNQRQMEREDTDAIITQLAQDLREAEGQDKLTLFIYIL